MPSLWRGDVSQMRGLYWWLTWVKAICLKGGNDKKKKKKQKTWQMNRFMGRRYLTLQIQLHRVKNEHNRLNIHEIKKKKTLHVIGPECGRSVQNLGLTLWASQPWVHPGYSDVSPCTQKSPFETKNICQGRRGIFFFFSDYSDWQFKSMQWQMCWVIMTTALSQESNTKIVS